MAQVAHILDGILKTRSHSIIRGAMADDLQEVKAALEEDPECINDQDDRMGVTAMHVAAADGNMPLVEFLLEQPGCNPSIFDAAGRQPSECAYVIGRDDILDAIVEHGMKEMAARWKAEEAAESSRDTVVRLVPRGPRPGP